MRSAKPRIAAIVGPTASGKTALAVALRHRGLPIEVVCCDALQLVRGLDAATAKPSAEERAAVPHHLVDVIAPTEAADAGAYALLADAAIADILSRDAWPLLVGGTGLYHRAVVRGLAQLPASVPSVRAALELDAATLGMAAMHARLGDVDPAYADTTPVANRQRVLRALEGHTLTGRAFSAFHAEHAAQADRYSCATVVLEPERESHLRHVAARARLMAPDLLIEVAQLLAAGLQPTAPGMQALGYRQAAAMILSRDTDQAETRTAQDDSDTLTEVLTVGHRRYAKRQRTWFRKTPAALRVMAPQADVAQVAAVLRQWFS